MTAIAFLELKQKLSQLTESERKHLSVHLIRPGHERPAWEKEAARRLNEMAAGKKVSAAALRKAA